MEELEFYKTKTAYLISELNRLQEALIDAQIKSGDIRLNTSEEVA